MRSGFASDISVLGIISLVLTGCIVPYTTHQILVTHDAERLPPSERCIMRTSAVDHGYRFIDPLAPDVTPGYLMFRSYYFPPGAIALTPGEHTFRVGAHPSQGCQVTLDLTAGHDYRPVDLACRTCTFPNENAEYHAACWPSNAKSGYCSVPASDFCAVLEDVLPDGTRNLIGLPCEFAPLDQVDQQQLKQQQLDRLRYCKSDQLNTIGMIKEAGIYCPNADLGHVDAQIHIADIHYHGYYGQKVDPVRAWVWYSLAAQSGDAQAAEQLTRVTAELSPEQLKEAKRQLAAWTPGQCMEELSPVETAP